MTAAPVSTPLPRVAIAAPASGHGKTTVATGIMAALHNRGCDVAGFKVGPDFIDPGYHGLATGKPGRNLDPFLTSEELIAPLLLHGASTPISGDPEKIADIAVIEGVMGLFDGRIGSEGFASTAHVARLTRTPIVLVLDISHISRTAGALVHGLATYDPTVALSGVILNKSASARHDKEVRSAVEAAGIPVVGVLPRDAGIAAPSRHLGLVPVEERDEAADTIALLAERVADHIDLDAIAAIAAKAAPLTTKAWSPHDHVTPVSQANPRIAVAGGRAFTFRYAETTELMRAGGLEPFIFDPTGDEPLPDDVAGIYLGGGFPQVHAAALSQTAATDSLAHAVRRGVPTVAECAGYLYLSSTLDGHPMAGVLPAHAAMGPRLTLGYRQAIAPTDSFLAPAGSRVTGHEFHRTATTVDISRGGPAWLLDGQADGIVADPAARGRATVHASYLHTHWAGHPELAQAFANAAHEYAALHVEVPRGA
ncbi:cobyrinate a,c-diamide synthase [Epidermidibacterium keratini]|uniref:Hydrogenobyrinate a,c-diamide synthase n=1 Tax=Epidermidibacterium keratini TaxID=1891644 RepID=A0A7L4YL70_9ACTN|nr:cobyrinate a,c-diamide synthase [Epidermidibacterium keratini]QHB99869.1 cobyrinate a,c-diamide synthase [Epidermidibacterium keratini]